MHRNALQAAMVLNIQDVSETAHLTLKGVYHNCDLQGKYQPGCNCTRKHTPELY
jgi:hypothetical protein